jgi:hypothetical protein
LKHFVQCNRSLTFKSQQYLYFFPENQCYKKKTDYAQPTTAYRYLIQYNRKLNLYRFLPVLPYLYFNIDGVCEYGGHGRGALESFEGLLFDFDLPHRGVRGVVLTRVRDNLGR